MPMIYVLLMKTYMEARPTTSMKKGWLYRTSYDEKNWEITPFDRDNRRSDDDDDPMMIQLWWWSSDDPSLMMVQWWSNFDDDPALMMIQWWSNFDDDLEKKNYTDELCQENTFLVKRECWCICNFGMYSLVYLILYPDVPIGRIICISLYSDVPIKTVINIINSCKSLRLTLYCKSGK